MWTRSQCFLHTSFPLSRSRRTIVADSPGGDESAGEAKGSSQTSPDSEDPGQHPREAEPALPVNHIWHTWTIENSLADNPVICLCCHVANIWMRCLLIVLSGGRGGGVMIECLRTVILRGCGLRSARPQKPTMESLGCQGELGGGHLSITGGYVQQRCGEIRPEGNRRKVVSGKTKNLET